MGLIQDELFKAELDIVPQQVIAPGEDDCGIVGIIYLITCKETGKEYVGLTKRPAYSRWTGHISDVSREPNKELYQDMKRYGLECFKFEVLYQAPLEMLSDLERTIIRERNTKEMGYNTSAGGSYFPELQGKPPAKPERDELEHDLVVMGGKAGVQEHYEITRDLLETWLAEYGISDWDVPARSHRLTANEKPKPEDLERMIQKMSIRQMSALYGIEPSTMRYYIRKYRVENPRSNPKVTGKKFENEPSPDEIRACVAEGMNATQIGHHFNIPPRVMREIMKRNGIQNPHTRNTNNKVKEKPTAEQLAELLKTKLRKEIAAEYGVSPSAVSYWIKVYGIEYHSPNNHSKGLQACLYTKEELQRFLDEYGTIKEASKALGVSEGTLYARYRTNGFQLSHRATSTMIDLESPSSTTAPPAPPGK